MSVQTVLGTLPLCVLLLVTGGFVLTRPRGQREMRCAALWAAVLTGLWTVIGTEVFSAFHSIGFAALLAWWGVPVVGLLVFVGRAWKRRVVRSQDAADRGLPDAPRAAQRDPWLMAGICVCVVVLGITGFLAAMTPPNNSDAMAYHLPRQVMWMQQRSVELYPANNLRQVTMPPMAEYLGLHLMTLSGGDAWHNLIQWVAFVLVVSTASLIARDLGADARGQVFSALAAATAPATLMQGSNAKNDVVLALWIMALAYGALRVLIEGRCSLGRAAMIGSALGLALLTKGSGPIYALPLCAIIGVTLLIRRGWRCWSAGIVIGAVAAALNAGYWARNMEVYGGPLGPPDTAGGYQVKSQSHSPVAITSSVVRNAALHAALPSAAWNAWLESAIVRLHDGLGTDVNAPETTYAHSPKFVVQWTPFHEDSPGSPAHLALAFVLVPAGLIAVKRRRSWNLALLLFASYAGFLLLCVLLKWQVWNARLHIPAICLLAAVAGPVLCLGRTRWIARVLSLAMIAAALPPLVTNERKPLLGPDSVFRTTRDERRHLFSPRCREAKGDLDRMVARVLELEPRTIGTSIGNAGGYEYLIMRGMMDAGLDARFTSLFGMNGPKAGAAAPTPDVVIWAAYRGGYVEHPPSGTRYTLSERFGPYWIFTPLPPEKEIVEPFPADLVSVADRFRGWTSIEGLDPPEGPYPQWDLPQVRWGVGRRTTLVFEADGRERALVMTCRRNENPMQTMVVRMNGRELLRHTFGGQDFQTIRVPLGAAHGRTTIVLEYVRELDPEKNPRGLSVLFKALTTVRSTG